MKTYIQLLTIISATLAAMSLSGCGKSESGAASKPAAQAASVQKEGPKEGRAIAITGNDTMKFSLTEIRAKPGEALAVTLRGTTGFLSPRASTSTPLRMMPRPR